MLGHQQHVIFKQRALHLLPLASHGALRQRRQRADGAKQTAHDVIDAAARAQWVPWAAGHVGESAHHLHHLVQRGAVRVRAGQKPFQADVHQPLVQRRQTGVVQPQRGHGAGFEVFNHHIGAGQQFERRFPARWGVEVQRQAFFVAVEQREKPGARAQQPPGVVARQRLDFDDLGPQVGQHQPAGWAHHHVGELNHAQARKGQG